MVSYLHSDFIFHGQQVCKIAIPTTSYSDLYSALVCGLSVQSDQYRQLFFDSGLIHIMVVSGAHLVFLEQLLSPFPKAIRLIALLFYAWLTGFGPPVTRALIRRLIAPFAGEHGASSLQIEAFTSLIVLVLIPSWLTSRSFCMSWVCALTFSTPKFFGKFDQSLKAYGLLYLYSPSSPISILWNILLGPLVGAILFPASLLAMIAPMTLPVTDFLWSLFLEVLKSGPTLPPSPWFIATYELLWWPLLIHFIFLIAEVPWRRSHAFS